MPFTSKKARNIYPAAFFLYMKYITTEGNNAPIANKNNKLLGDKCIKLISSPRIANKESRP